MVKFILWKKFTIFMYQIIYVLYSLLIPLFIYTVYIGWLPIIFLYNIVGAVSYSSTTKSKTTVHNNGLLCKSTQVRADNNAIQSSWSWLINKLNLIDLALSLSLSNDMVTTGSLYSKIWEHYDKEWWLTLLQTPVSWGVISWLRGKSMHTMETFHHLTEYAATEVPS